MLQRLKATVAAVHVDGHANGTAFLVHRSFAITALHVVHGSPDVKLHFPLWCKPNRDRTAATKWTEPRWDIAILALDEPAPESIVPFPWCAIPAVGVRWSAYGFPRNISQGHTLPPGEITDPEYRWHDDEDDSTLLQLRNSSAQYWLDGFSGSPCVVDNAIAGVLTTQLKTPVGSGPARGRSSGEQSPQFDTVYAVPFARVAPCQEVLQFKIAVTQAPPQTVLRPSRAPMPAPATRPTQPTKRRVSGDSIEPNLPPRTSARTIGHRAERSTRADNGGAERDDGGREANDS